MRATARLAAAAVAAVVVVVVVVVVGAVWFGALRLGGLSTRAEPGTAERLLARYAKHVAVPREARTATNPLAFSPEVWADARAHFADHCASCHANDGSGDTALGRNLYPKAPDMRQAATQSMSDGELYWIIENGVRLTGMPAWGTGGPDDTDTWKLVHFVRRLKDLSPEDLAEMAALNPRTPAELREEQDDARFLSGEDTGPATPTPPPSQHHHQE